uniref:[Histone H3]-trimethyl-L-lysine(4) demethylase n=1 Tax=Rhodosorus marinus TaxID=101924 RepID=A0A7S2ZJM0_9RHOD|mmetsp:Transcript_20441/g.82580  ORF Transcript_20441/g.82580 Transcript_20441/m.82580 type:complete len:622 (+) Transcript_20441:222-2087(+)
MGYSLHKLKDRSPAPEQFMRRLKLFHRDERKNFRLRQEQGTENGEKQPHPRLKYPPRVSVTDQHGTGADLSALFNEVRTNCDGGRVSWDKVANNLKLFHPRNPKELEMIYELYLSKYEERVSKNGDNFLEDFEKHLVKERQEEKAKLATEAAVVDLTCHKCESGKDDEQLLICDSCETGWHMFCMTPPMKRLPPEDELWFCPNCDPGAGKEFGFDVGEDFSLEEFKEYATAIRNNWFHDLGREPTIDEIEEQYWKISGEAERLVYIPYGSDLDTREVGSGFPNPRNEKHSGGEYDEYLRCPWNLNIFPELNGSLLSYLTESIKGVTVPWLYLGMIFSSFCYHTEDSYMYSINYHHFGAPKIWYGTSGGKGAAHFEAAMRSAAPKLFDANPGLFYHLTTMVSPIDLMNRGAKVVRAVQNPGEFVMTFPQAYHGGFSTGFNCGEAVNFITADWIPFGRAASARYKIHKWEPVFCHEEIILRTVFSPYFKRKAFPRDAKLLYAELAHIVARERALREKMLFGIPTRRRVEPSALKHKICEECKQIPFLSAVELRNPDTRCKTYFCSEHWTTLQKEGREEFVALYTHTDEELKQALTKVKEASISHRKIAKKEIFPVPQQPIIID